MHSYSRDSVCVGGGGQVMPTAFYINYLQNKKEAVIKGRNQDFARHLRYQTAINMIT